jgi:hypothetical protein
MLVRQLPPLFRVNPTLLCVALSSILSLAAPLAMYSVMPPSLLLRK